MAVEEPLEIRLDFLHSGSRQARPVAVTMRTPGQDVELAAGFLFSEGILGSRNQILNISKPSTEGVGPAFQDSRPVPRGDVDRNILSVRLQDHVIFDKELLNRNFYMTSSCGVCGKASIEALEVQGCTFLTPGRPKLAASVLDVLPRRLREGQAVFQRTGGLHAAGLFNPRGELETLREDVGRHNAVDKVIGHGFLEGRLPLENRVLVVSGRTSFEIVQKVVKAGIPVLVAVGAPSSLAVELARSFGVTLVGFARGGGFNVYSGEERILDWEGEGK